LLGPTDKHLADNSVHTPLGILLQWSGVWEHTGQINGALSLVISEAKVIGPPSPFPAQETCQIALLTMLL
jgi:hypothetical protein